MPLVGLYVYPCLCACTDNGGYLYFSYYHLQHYIYFYTILLFCCLTIYFSTDLCSFIMIFTCATYYIFAIYDRLYAREMT